MGAVTPSQDWAARWPGCPEFEQRTAEVFEVICQASDNGRDMAMTKENLEWVNSIWDAFEESSPIHPAMRESKAAWEKKMPKDYKP